MGVDTPGDTPSSGGGTCSGTCENPTATVAISDTPTTVKVLWEDFAGGVPEAGPDPSAVLAIWFRLDWVEGGTPYDIDITIDDFSFIGD